jgi:hypothetical protein
MADRGIRARWDRNGPAPCPGRQRAVPTREPTGGRYTVWDADAAGLAEPAWAGSGVGSAETGGAGCPLREAQDDLGGLGEPGSAVSVDHPQPVGVAACAGDETDLVQGAQVVGDGGLADAEIRDDRPNRHRPVLP